MKFAHEFQAALQREGFPEDWVKAAFPYKQLKKSIKRVRNELEEHNVDLANLPEGSFEYDFEGDRKGFTPKLTLIYEDKVNSTATQPVRTVLSLFPPDPPTTAETIASLSLDGSSNEESSSASITKTRAHLISDDKSNKSGFRQVEIVIPLTFDTEFFQLIQGDVKTLDTIQERERNDLIQEIENLSKQLVQLSEPSKYKKTDMNRWRELFEIYLEAGVFFSTSENNPGYRTSTIAKRQLEWFQSEVTRRDLLSAFKLPASQEALSKFLQINVTLWQNLKYQEINQQAIGKILKKFDKRTHLGARKTFPKLIATHPIMSAEMAKAVCSQLNNDIVKVTPQVSDYLCPVCTSIVWRPVMLQCKHALCTRCAVVLQRQRRRFCPLCRGDVVMIANTDNIDEELSRYLKKFFPKEVRQKQIDNETAHGRELFGVLYTHPSEQRCSIM